MNPSTPPRSPSRRSTPERRAATRREAVSAAARSPSKLIENIKLATAQRARINSSAMSPASKKREMNAINARIQRARENIERHLKKLTNAANLAHSVLYSATITHMNMGQNVNNATRREALANIVSATRKANTANAEVKRFLYFMHQPQGSRGSRMLATALRA